MAKLRIGPRKKKKTKARVWLSKAIMAVWDQIEIIKGNAEDNGLTRTVDVLEQIQGMLTELDDKVYGEME